MLNGSYMARVRLVGRYVRLDQRLRTLGLCIKALLPLIKPFETAVLGGLGGRSEHQ